MQGILVLLFFIGMGGDAYTSFLGILSILGIKSVIMSELMGNLNDRGSYILALVGTSVITGINIMSVDVFERKEKIIFLLWAPAIVIDFISSLAGSFGFIKPEANPFLAYFLVVFITIFITASPAMLRYILLNPFRD